MASFLQSPNTLDLFDRFFGSAPSAAGFRIDWKETPEVHVYKAELPGVKKGDVKVELENQRDLLIIAERRGHEDDDKGGDGGDDDVQTKNVKWHLKERSSGSKYFRRFRLPEDADVDAMKASMENGLLTLTVPKRKVKRPEVRPIDIATHDKKGSGKSSKKDGPVCCKFWP